MSRPSARQGIAFLAASTLLALIARAAPQGGPAAAVLPPGSWPQWRGPAGTGVSDETDLPLRWSSREGVLWTAELPGWGASTPAIWGNALFVTSQDGDDLLLLRLSKSDGKVEWKRTVGTGTIRRDGRGRGEQKFHRNQNLASPSPITDGEVVIAHFGNGDLAAYDLKGEQLWKRNLAEDHGKYTIWWGHANSPVLAGDLVISICIQDSLEDQGGDSPSYLVAHEKRTGKERWKKLRKTGSRSEDCDSYTTPVLRPVAGTAELVVMGANTLDGWDPATGERLWWLPGLGGSRTISGPTLGAGLVFATEGKRGALVAVKPSGRGELPESSILWRHGEATPDSPSPVVSDGLVFIVSDGGVATCMEAETGKVRWKERLSPGDYRASPLAAAGRVYFLSDSGMATVARAAPAFEKLAENKLDDQTLASPAVSEGRLYLRGKKKLYCLGAAGKAADRKDPLSLFDGKTLQGWRPLTDGYFDGHGAVKVEDGAIVLEKGEPMTGITCTHDVPKEGYEVSLEAKRLEGYDFFCGLTFPVGEGHCSLIIGGWGGGVIGLSNVDGMSAAENSTSSMKEFQDKRWYRIRLQVTEDDVQAWIDDDRVVNLIRGSHRFAVWPQQEGVRPFGIDTYRTKGALRKIELRKL